MITEITLHNFKSWKKIDDVPLAQITALFGSNSSGKTSFLQLLLMLKQTTESSDRSQVINLGDDRSLVQLGSFNDIIFKHKKDSFLSWSIGWNLKKELKIDDPEHKGQTLFEGINIKFRAEIKESDTKGTIVNWLTYRFNSHDFVIERKANKYQYNISASGQSDFNFNRIQGRAWDLPAPMKCYGFPDQVKAYYKNAGFLGNFELAFEELFSHVYYLGPLRDYPKREYTWSGAQPADVGQRGERVVDALLASRNKNPVSRGQGRKRLTVEEYVAKWLKDLNLIHTFEVKRITKNSNLYQVWVQKTPGSEKVLITDVGFGVSQILPVITLCYYVPEGSTILMEQPEIHLHPSVQAGLADVFIDAARIRGIQIILESHSEYLLKRLQRRVAEEEISSDMATIYFCEMEKDGQSKLTHLETDLYGNITNWPKDFFGDQFGEIAAMTEARTERKRREQE
ncbi:MAG: hypothetical protein IEMM0008_0248 [bacterium]|nr:MAG: hypothetical protein IEMM0008_0248 [bacterium]